jgi:hypothetical protein
MLMVPRCAGENHSPNGPELTPPKGYNRTRMWRIAVRKKVGVTGAQQNAQYCVLCSAIHIANGILNSVADWSMVVLRFFRSSIRQ